MPLRPKSRQFGHRHRVIFAAARRSKWHTGQECRHARFGLRLRTVLPARRSPTSSRLHVARGVNPARRTSCCHSTPCARGGRRPADTASCHATTWATSWQRTSRRTGRGASSMRGCSVTVAKAGRARASATRSRVLMRTWMMWARSGIPQRLPRKARVVGRKGNPAAGWPCTETADFDGRVRPDCGFTWQL